MKEKIEKAFKELYPGKRLLAALVNDMYISVGFDEGKGSGKGDEGVTQHHYDFGTKSCQGKMKELKEKVLVGPYSCGHTCGSHTGIEPQER